MDAGPGLGRGEPGPGRHDRAAAGTGPRGQAGRTAGGRPFHLGRAGWQGLRRERHPHAGLESVGAGAFDSAVGRTISSLDVPRRASSSHLFWRGPTAHALTRHFTHALIEASLETARPFFVLYG